MFKLALYFGILLNTEFVYKLRFGQTTNPAGMQERYQLAAVINVNLINQQIQLCNNIPNKTHTICFEKQTLFLGNKE